MVRLLFDHQVFQLQRRGGASRVFYEILKRLRLRSDINTSLYAGINSSAYDLKSLSSASLSVTSQHTEAGALRNFGAKLNRLALPIYAASQHFDVYHPTFYVNALPFKKVRRVATALDMIHELYPHLFSKDDKIRARKKDLFSSADLIIAISEHTKKDLIDILNIPSDKIRVVALAQDLPETHDAHKPSSGRPYFLYVGLRDGYKNFKQLLTAFKKSGLSMDFDLLSFGGGIWTDEERKMISELELQSSVHQTSGDDTYLAQVYSGAFAFVYPSLYEGFGIPPLEAMAKSCPVICSDSSSIPEVVGQAALLFDPKSEESLIHALQKIVQDSGFRSGLIESGLIQVSHFSWDKTFEGHLNVYKELT